MGAEHQRRSFIEVRRLSNFAYLKK